MFSKVHVYVKDPQNLFTPVRSVPVQKLGSSVLLPCRLTDPAATDFSLRMENGSPVPAGMNYTADPRRGIQIYDLRHSYSAKYVCSARIGGVEKISRPILIQVSQRLHQPPYVSLDKDEYVRLVGEELIITCTTHNHNLNFQVAWHSSGKTLSSKKMVDDYNGRWRIRRVLTIPTVNVSDAGNLTCKAWNEAGVNSFTARLQVVDQPYIRLSPGPLPGKNGTTIEVNEGEDLELRVRIQAYPELNMTWWDTPRFHNHSVEFYQHNNRYEAALLLKRMKSGEQGQYVFLARSSKVNASIAFHIKMFQTPSAKLRWENATTLTCTSFGYPAPKILWYRCSGIRSTCVENEAEGTESLVAQAAVRVRHEEYGPAEVTSTLSIPLSGHGMTVECLAINSVGKNQDTFVMDVSRKAETSPLYVTYGEEVWLSKILTPTLAGTAFLFLLLMIIFLYKYKQKPRYEIRWKIIEASEGNHYTFIDPSQLPYSDKWEFPRDKLKLGKVLGAGAFGEVVEATAYGLGKEDSVLRVAVKMLKSAAHSEEREALMCELKILSHLGQHRNIVNLLGACTHGGPVLVITEYCCHGDLLNFLRSRAESFLNVAVNMTDALERSGDYTNISAKKPYIRSDSGISCSFSDGYQDMKPVRRLTGSSQDPCGEEAELDTWPLDINDLLGFSSQVAQGLEFLASKNCIHRDVAARNVLLTESRVAKICDFGLARDIMNDSNYVVKGNARLPVKWMAPESIFDCVYTVQSDVWSYGILLWEIFSLGTSPYPGVPVDSRFYQMIKDGCQMCQPEFSSPEMYAIIKACWNLEPTDRPTFSKIVQTTGQLLHDSPEQAYKNMLKDSLDHQPESCCGNGEKSCDHEDEGQPLMNTNNYQLC
ncbi:hypothetical protein SKAU_G00267390 [Synaphobranchus kaupii]|uniref:receptor protein-tyrosine kinase n=1 Tax=Synaphobranchus kaupii TaxID=118154 RepID=A0A9Q1IPB1_SYNKA|nr:hypothetical protein SKAU_G00267390 [Synaphobranchus kaupii]